MKITLDKDVLLEKLAVGLKFVSNRLSSIPALQGILMEKKEGTIYFYATNLIVYYQSYIETEDKKDNFRIVVEAKKIVEFLSLLPSGKIEIEIKENTVYINSKRNRGSFPTIESGDFPEAPKITEAKQKIKSSFLEKNLPLIAFATAADETRPVLTGINLITQDEDLIMVATDGFRLSLLKTKKEIDIPQAIVPADFLMEVVSLTKKETEVDFVYSSQEKAVAFLSGKDRFFSRLIEGDFPQFEKVVPTEKKTSIELDKEEFQRNIKLVSIFARDFSNIVVLQTTETGLRISPKTDDNEVNSASQEAVIKGEPQKVAFNFKYLLDFLNHLTAKKVFIEINRSDGPVVFKSEDRLEFLHIIMPVRIQ